VSLLTVCQNGARLNDSAERIHVVVDIATDDVDHAAALSALLAVARRLPTAAVARLAGDAATLLPGA
jgi:hypothetical protein